VPAWESPAIADTSYLLAPLLSALGDERRFRRHHCLCSRRHYSRRGEISVALPVQLGKRRATCSIIGNHLLIIRSPARQRRGNVLLMETERSKDAPFSSEGSNHPRETANEASAAASSGSFGTAFASFLLHYFNVLPSACRPLRESSTCRELQQGWTSQA
jgi:hypothetical protein